jgi:dolichol-phosphate mannosyltransferase
MDQHTGALIVIPTYNEAENLEAMIREINALPLLFDVLIVDDHSPDGTGEIADRLSQALPNIYVMHRAGKLGLGTAYIAGFRWALERDYAYVMEMDCDFSHHPRYLPNFMEQIANADLVIGSRYVPGGGTPDWGLYRRLMSRGGNLFARFMLGLRTHDCTGGYRCYRRATIKQVPWDEIGLQGYGFQIGAVYHIERMGGRIAEFPIIFDDRQLGNSKMSKDIVIEAIKVVAQLALRGGRLGKRRVTPQR